MTDTGLKWVTRLVLAGWVWVALMAALTAVVQMRAGYAKIRQAPLVKIEYLLGDQRQGMSLTMGIIDKRYPYNPIDLDGFKEVDIYVPMDVGRIAAVGVAVDEQGRLNADTVTGPATIRFHGFSYLRVRGNLVLSGTLSIETAPDWYGGYAIWLR